MDEEKSLKYKTISICILFFVLIVALGYGMVRPESVTARLYIGAISIALIIGLLIISNVNIRKKEDISNEVIEIEPTEIIDGQGNEEREEHEGTGEIQREDEEER